MILDRVLAEVQLLGDVTIAGAVHEQRQDLALAVAQIWWWDS